MRTLDRCSKAYGHVRVKDSSPEIEIYRDVLYENGGLYDWRRRLIPNAALFQGVRLPDRLINEPYQARTTEIEPTRVLNEAPDEVYIWGGPLTSHYGHFLLDTLSRLSFLHKMPMVRPKVLFWSKESPESRYLQDFQKVLFDRIGLSDENMVFFDRPTLIRQILVQAPAFECNSYIHRDYAVFCNLIGNEIADWNTEKDTQPVYISKHNLNSGVARLVNEEEIVRQLDYAGVKIISPESLSIKQQIEVWKRHDCIAGYLGSATHTALFSTNKRTAIINHESQVYSNQIMIDIACGHQSEYLSFGRSSSQIGGGNGFQLNFCSLSPDKLATDWLRVIDGLASRSTVSHVYFGSRSIDIHAYIDEPFGSNLSIGCSANQSSIFPPHSRGTTTMADAMRAVDGQAHDRYACHTMLETDPWWEVDLGNECVIHEVRIFNRIDIGNENSRRLRILLSTNGVDFVEKHVRDGEPFGYPSGRPYRWLCEQNYVTRFVRLQLLNRTYLHLLQVEVFGEVV